MMIVHQYIENNLYSTNIQYAKLVDGCLMTDCININDENEQKKLIW